MKLPFRFTKMIFTKGKISAWWQGRCAHIGSRSLGMVTVLRIIPMIIREWYRRILWEIWHRVLYIRLKVGHVLWRRNGRHVLAHAARGATLIHVIERLWTGWHTMGHVWRKIPDKFWSKLSNLIHTDESKAAMSLKARRNAAHTDRVLAFLDSELQSHPQSV